MTEKNRAVQNAERGFAGTGENGAALDKAAARYEVKQRVTLAEVPGLRVRLLTLLKGQIVPWHLHNHITDTFFCMRGPMRVLTRSPDASHRLLAGDTLAVSAGTAHRVECGDANECRFMIIQGVGEYDYVPVKD